jgi:tetratricopeptide (TPR) repeat protein
MNETHSGRGGPPEIAGYEVIGSLGEGGMGAVFLARDKLLDRRVAIKVISGKLSNDPQARERFLREARTLATVEHPNVVRVYSFGELNDEAYLVLEYVEGSTLAERIAGSGQMAVDDALRYMRQIVDALDAAHEHGIVHRDIKPSNILIGRRDDVRVADFGLAKPVTLGDTGETSLTQTGYMLGTPHYVSPEQALGKPVDFRSDIYSLGIVFYEMLTAERPFQGTTPMAIVAGSLHDAIPDIREKRPDVPRDVIDLIHWMTNKKPAERPSSYAELSRALSGEGPTKPQRSRVPPSSRFVRPLPIIALAVTLGLAGGLALHYATGSAPPADATSTQEMVVAVVPFWGPDDISAREGRVMAALIERSIESRLGSQVTVAGIDATANAIRSHEQARELGRRLGAGVVVWGEALALRDETELQPSFTLVNLQRKPEATDATQNAAAIVGPDVRDLTAERQSEPLRLSADAPDQIEMRRMSADGVGEVVTFLAGLHSLHVRDDPAAALAFFEQSAPSADLLRHQAEALVLLERKDEALEIVRRAVEIDPSHAAARAQLADFLWVAGDREAAEEHYRAAAESGGPVDTVQASLHQGRLFVRELWETDSGDIRDTSYLLVVDPESDRVLERHYLPGEIILLRSSNEELTIRWSDRLMASDHTLVWRDGGFTSPIYGGGDLLRRMNGVKSGMEIGLNFTTGSSGRLEDQEAHPRYRLPDDATQINAARPASVEELESFLIPAIERDRTQPWYPVHLGFVQKITGREEESRATWSAIFDRDWPGIPYWEFSWMARFYERLGEPEWADRAFGKALEIRRRSPQEVVWSILIERLIVAPYVRLHEAALDDPERAYEWLSRARDLTGSTDGSLMETMVWAAYFEQQGDLARAEREARYRDSAFDPMSLGPRIDFIVYALFTLLVATPLFGGLLLWNGWRRARKRPREHRPTGFASAIVLTVILSTAAATTMVLAMSSSETNRLEASLALLGLLVFWVVFAAWLFIEEKRYRSITLSSLGRSVIVAFSAGVLAVAAVSGSLLMGAIGLLVPVVAFVSRRSRTGWRDVTARINRRERIALISMTSGAVLALALLVLQLAGLGRIAAMPIGVGDSFGHPQWTTHLDRLLSKGESRELLYAAAVSHHLAGDFETAISLYERIAGDQRAASGIAAARERRIAVDMPSGPELIAAVRTGSLPEISSVFREGKFFSEPLLVLVVIALFLLSFPMVLSFVSTGNQPEGDSAERSLSRWTRRAGLILPSFWWIRTERTVRGSVTLLLTIFVLTVAAYVAFVMLRSGPGGPSFLAPGIITAMYAPNLFTIFPVPLPGELTRADLPDLYFTAMSLGFSGARIFWTLVVLSAITLIGLHAMTITEIIRLRVRESISETETMVTPLARDVEGETLVKPV